MNGKRFDRFVPALGDEAHRRRVTSRDCSAAALEVSARCRWPPRTTSHSAGSGGYATASGNGGVVAVGDINSGGNVGNAVAVGDTYGSVWVDGGDVANSTTVGISADGGTAIADASGGSYNTAFVS